MMAKLLGGCVCGGSDDRPNDDCERCQLVELVKTLLCDLHDRRRRRIDDGEAADGIASDFGLNRDEVRRIVGVHLDRS
jgi:hypothetical protein